MTILSRIKKFLAPREAPYNWGASIEHLKHKIDDIDYRSSFQIRGLSELLNKSGDELQKRINQQASFFSDHLQAMGTTITLLKAGIDKLEKKAKKPKVKK